MGNLVLLKRIILLVFLQGVSIDNHMDRERFHNGQSLENVYDPGVLASLHFTLLTEIHWRYQQMKLGI